MGLLRRPRDEQLTGNSCRATALAPFEGSSQILIGLIGPGGQEKKDQICEDSLNSQKKSVQRVVIGRWIHRKRL